MRSVLVLVLEGLALVLVLEGLVLVLVLVLVLGGSVLVNITGFTCTHNTEQVNYIYTCFTVRQ